MREAGVTITHIPYKGSPAAVIAVLAGEVDLTISPTVSVSPYLHSGKLRALATPAPRRLALFPNVSTLVELGYPGIQIRDWQGIVAPAGTPKDVIARLHAEVFKVLASPDVRQRLEVLGLEVAGLGPEQFAAHMRNEIQTCAACFSTCRTRSAGHKNISKRQVLSSVAKPSPGTSLNPSPSELMAIC